MNNNKNFSVKNFKDISDKVEQRHENFILENINDHCLRMAVMQGEYPWHYHASTDELFTVLEGELKIEIREGGTITLKPGEFIIIPANTIPQNKRCHQNRKPHF